MKNKTSIKRNAAIVSRSYDDLTELAKVTPLGQKILKELQETPMEMWADDISPKGVVIGRMEMYSGRYEKAK